jgi:hypothetical protein
MMEITMKKKNIRLLILVGVLILLVAGYLLLNALVLSDEDTSADESSVGNTYNVCTVDQNTVNHIAYTADGRVYDFVLNEDATAWVWDEDPTLPLNNLFFANMVTVCRSLTSTVRLTDVTPAELTDYGLGEDALRIVFGDDAGGDRAYRVGAYNAYNGLRYFCLESNLTTVYMVDAAVADAFICIPYEMIALPTLPTDATPANLVRLTLTPAEGSTRKSLVCTYYASGKSEDERDVWYVSIDGGEEQPLDTTLGNELSTALTTMAFSGMVSYRADEQAAFGLDAPTIMRLDYKVTQNFQDETTGKTTSVNVDISFTLHLGNVDSDGLCFATAPDSPLSCKLMGEVFGQLLRMTDPT